jgi:hypothetical protein
MENSTEIKKMRKRSKKIEMSKLEREELLKELIELMNLNENNNKTLYELEHNEELKKKLRESSELVRKMYRCSSWGYYSQDKKHGKNHEIGLLKSIMKSEGYNILSKRKTLICDGKKTLQSELYFMKNNE